MSDEEKMNVDEEHENPDQGDQGSDEEGEGVMSEEHDSSEESGEDDPDEARKVAEGFIVDDEDDDGERRRRKKKKKKKHRQVAEDDDLDEDDLDLVEQNTGRRIERQEPPRRKLVRRERTPSEDLDDIGEDVGPINSVQNIFSDDEDAAGVDRGVRHLAANALDWDEEDDMDDFIEEDPMDEAEAAAVAEAKAKRETRRKQKSGFGGRMGGGVSKETWGEIQEIFGNGDDYQWAMNLDDAAENKPKPTLADIYEPAEIEERMLTAADDAIRSIDMPERMQLANASLLAARSDNEVEPILAPLLEKKDIPAAVTWISGRISDQLTNQFLLKNQYGTFSPLRTPFLAAVESAVEQLANRFFEVPFLWLHRRDYFVYFNPDNPDENLRRVDLLGRSHLWRIHSLSIKYRALLDRKSALRSLWRRMQIPQGENDDEDDGYFDEVFSKVESVEEVSDLQHWVGERYHKRLAVLKEEEKLSDELDRESGRVKRSTQLSRYARLRGSYVSQLAQNLAIPAWSLARDFVAGERRHFVDDPQGTPEQYAEEFAAGDALDPTGETALRNAKTLVAHDLGSDPLLRRELRRVFQYNGQVTVRPTEKGMARIDELHPNYVFKYLTNKPVTRFNLTPQFLYILEAERELEVTVSITLPATVRKDILDRLASRYLSDYQSEAAQKWNNLRLSLLANALDEHLIPEGARWLRDKLRDDAQDFIARRCSDTLEERVEAAPYCNVARGMEPGDIPSVVAISHGNGDAKRDFVHVVYLDENGNQREALKLPHLRPINPNQPAPDDDDDDETKDSRERLKKLLKERKPHLIVIGGFGASTHRLFQEVKTVVTEAVTDLETQGAFPMDVHFIPDEAARIYQHSRRADLEWPNTHPTFKYCIGLARYAQSPINEYCGLGKDLTAVTFDPAQKYVDPPELLVHLERALVNVVNTCGVDINRAVGDPYHALMLPYVAGLGPRKARGILNRINAISGSTRGTLINREDLVKHNITTQKIFMNCSAFLRIVQENLPAPSQNDSNVADVLDGTRIHPENYEIARKMASDAEELDEEDIQMLEHPSDCVRTLMQDDPNKLDDLSLDDFAVELQTLMNEPKRLTLYLSRDELKLPFREQRPPFKLPTTKQIFTTLTGETRTTLDVGFIIPVEIIRFRANGGMAVRLDSGIEGIIEPGYISDEYIEVKNVFYVTQTIPAVVNELNYDEFTVQLDCRSGSVASSDFEYRSVKPDQYFDLDKAASDVAKAEEKRKEGVGKAKRVVQHPNFYPYNAGQAEQHLASLARGECVIRPSSRGFDHLAVTWKVDEGVYSHIDVLELDKPSEHQLGRILKIGGKYSYSDLDELIVSHVRALARKIEDMINNEKFVKGSEEDLHSHLRTGQMANPDKSIYAFGLDRKHPGQFLLSFIAAKGQPIKTWPVKVVPGAYVLFDTEVPDIKSLCNAFKTRYAGAVASASHRNQSQRAPLPPPKAAPYNSYPTQSTSWNAQPAVSTFRPTAYQ